MVTTFGLYIVYGSNISGIIKDIAVVEVTLSVHL